jgi:hypothetical protein
MSRGLTGSMITELTATTVRPFYLFSAEFNVSTLRLASTPFDISWSSQTWLGNGWFNGLSSVRETEDVESSGIEVSLSGIPSSLVALVLSEARQNKRGKIYLGFFNSSGAIIADPFILWEGGLDVPKITDRPPPQSPLVSLSYVSDLARLRRTYELRYTDAMQKQLYSGDRGFEFVAKLREWSGYWGKKTKAKTKSERSGVKNK